MTAARARAIASAAGINLERPASISTMRRSTSTDQASSTSRSSKRLASNRFASCARSSAVSFRACASTVSSWLDIATPRGHTPMIIRPPRRRRRGPTLGIRRRCRRSPACPCWAAPAKPITRLKSKPHASSFRPPGVRPAKAVVTAALPEPSPRRARRQTRTARVSPRQALRSGSGAGRPRAPAPRSAAAVRRLSEGSCRRG